MLCSGLSAGGAGAQPLPQPVPQPSIPATYYGTVSIDGRSVPAGTEVRAFVGEMDCTQGGPQKVIISGGVSVYALMVAHDSQIPGCGRERATVTFQVSGKPAGQTSVWTTGVTEVDLNAGGGSPLPLPTATPMPTTGTAEAAATATESAKFTPLPAASLPTDQPFGNGTPPSGIAGGRNGPTTAGDSGTPFVVILLALVGGLGLIGAVAGLMLSRRRG